MLSPVLCYLLKDSLNQSHNPMFGEHKLTCTKRVVPKNHITICIQDNQPQCSARKKPIEEAIPGLSPAGTPRQAT